jgi:hypothetical protein
MQVPLRPGIELVCNCRAGHRGNVTDEGVAPALPNACTGSFWSLPLGPGSSGRIYGAVASVGVIAPSSSRCAYLT